MFKTNLKLFLFFGVLVFSMAGCVKNTSPQLDIASPGAQAPGMEPRADKSSEVWGKYSKMASAESVRPFRLEGSLRYTPPKGNGNRLSFYLWSNGDEPFRLDATAGFGSTVIGAREAENDFLAYVPEDKKAYAHKGVETPRFVLPKLGEPLPLSIGNMAKLLEGRFDQLFDREYSLSAIAEPGAYPDLGRNFEGYSYTLLRGELPGELILNSAGQPVLWKGGDGWSMYMEYAETSDLKVRKLTIVHGKGHKAIIMVKERDYPERFNDAQLALLLPSGVEVLPIKRME